MTNLKDESDSDDSAPEAISFGASKLENVQQAMKVKEQVSLRFKSILQITSLFYMPLFCFR
jgi:hypothetical protein